MLARLGAEVVKVEHPVHGESGRASTPAMLDPEGRKVGATYLRNNLNKRSLGIDLKSPEGRELFLALAGRFDVVAENFKAGTMDRMGLGYDAIAAAHPRVDLRLDLRASATRRTRPYRDWPAYASIVEAMSGIYEYKSGPDQPPVTIPVGALGDISSALFAVIGILAALRHRDHTGLGPVRRHRDARRDGRDDRRRHQLLVDGRAARAGQGPRGDLRGVPGVRRLRRRADRRASTSSRRSPSSSATRSGTTTRGSRPAPAGRRNLETVIRPAVDAWASQHTKLEAAPS